MKLHEFLENRGLADHETLRLLRGGFPVVLSKGGRGVVAKLTAERPRPLPQPFLHALGRAQESGRDLNVVHAAMDAHGLHHNAGDNRRAIAEANRQILVSGRRNLEYHQHPRSGKVVVSAGSRTDREADGPGGRHITHLEPDDSWGVSGPGGHMATGFPSLPAAHAHARTLADAGHYRLRPPHPDHHAEAIDCPHCNADTHRLYPTTNDEEGCAECTGTCGECNGRAHEDDMAPVRMGPGEGQAAVPVCTPCREGDNIRTCAACNEDTHEDDLAEVVNPQLRRSRGLGRENPHVCSDCFGEHYFRCHDCGTNHHEDNSGGTNTDEEPVCEGCGESYFYCDGCNTTHHSEDYGEDGQCTNCSGGKQESDLVHHARYEPDEWIHYGKGGRHMGVELETTTKKKGNLHEAAQDTLDKLNDGDPDEPFAFLKEDGSLKEDAGGFEIVSHPATLEEHKKRWPAFLGKNAHPDLKSHDTGCCGMHVHLDKSGLSEFHVGKMLEFVNAKANRAFMEKVARRPHGEWAEYDDSEKIASVRQPRGSNRYRAVNLIPKKTVEFRIFKGTLKPQSFYRTLEFVDALQSFTHTHAPHSLVGTEEFAAHVAKGKASWPHLHAMSQEFHGHTVDRPEHLAKVFFEPALFHVTMRFGRIR